MAKFSGRVDKCGEKNETELRVEIDTEIVVLRRAEQEKLDSEKTENFIKNVRKFGIKRGVVT